MKKFGLFILCSSLFCSAFAQEVNEEEVVIADTVSVESMKITDAALLRSWRKAFPFQQLSDSAYQAAEADTLFVEDPETRTVSYSAAKRSADSLMAQVRSVPFDKERYVGQIDYRMPIMNTGKVPENKVSSFLANVNALSVANLAGAPADAAYTQMEEARSLREMTTYAYAKQYPSRFKYVRGNIDVPTNIAREKVSSEHVLEGKTIQLAGGIQAIGQIEGITSQVKTDKWHRKGQSTFQLSQTALSDNWYKGGDDNMTASTVQRLELTTFDENKKSSFDLLLELRLSALYTKADTVNSLRVNDNQFSATIKYGYQAWKRWYYSTSLYAKTPILDYHNANSRVTRSTFLAPLESNLSVGLEYKYNTKDKRIQYSLLLAPFAYNLKYVATERVNAQSYGIEEGKNTLHQFGTTVSSSLNWKISNSVSWNSRFYYFTSYESIQVEFENTFNFSLGRNFTSTLYIYPRFDDKLDDKIQVKEMLAFGFNYIW